MRRAKQEIIDGRLGSAGEEGGRMELGEYKKDYVNFFNDSTKGTSDAKAAEKPGMGKPKQRKEQLSAAELAKQNKLPKRDKVKGLDRDKEVEQYARNVNLLVDFAREKHKQLSDVKRIAQINKSK